MQARITLAQKKLEVASKAGDISGVLNQKHNVPNLEWLNVDVEEYRKFEALPKQNFDMLPELESYFSEESTSDLIPNPIHVIVNTNPSEHPNVPLAQTGEQVKRRTARLVMEGLPVAEIVSRLAAEFAPEDIRAVGNDVRALVAQRGLLGPVYIEASHFPRYAQTGSDDSAFVAKYAKEALYVVASSVNEGLPFNRNVVASADDIPYDSLLGHYQEVLNRNYLKLASASDARTALRLSFTLRESAAPVEVRTIHKPMRLHKNVEHRVAAPTFTLSSDYVKFARRMMDGRDDRTSLQASGSNDLSRLAAEYGTLGHEYLDVDALGGCGATLAWLRRASKKTRFAPKYLLRRDASCTTCGDMKDTTCDMLSRVSSFVQELPRFDRRDFVLSCVRAREAGRLNDRDFQSIIQSRKASDNWKTLISRVNTHIAAPIPVPVTQHTQRAHYSSVDPVMEVDGEELRVYIARQQNAGVHGERLRQAILLRYPEEGVRRHASILREAARVDEVQGSHFVDPSCYSDYGRGCAAGAKQFRGTGPKHVLACSSCTGCKLQTHPGWCSKYAKTMIRPMPDAEIEQIRMASRKSLPVIQAAVRDPGREWELAGPSGDIELPGVRKGLDIKIPGM